MVFSVVIHGCECWTIKKTGSQRVDAFKLWRWIRLWRVPWAARRSNQSILMEINHEYSLKRLMFKLKLQSLGYLTRRADSLEKTLMLGKTEAKRIRGPQRMRKLDGISDSRDMNLNKFREIVKDREVWHTAIHGVTKESDMTEWLNNKCISGLPKWLDDIESATKQDEKVKVKVAQLCPTLCDPVDYNTPGSSVHGILQVRILEWVDYPFSSLSAWSRIWTMISCIAGGFFTSWVAMEAIQDTWIQYWVRKFHWRRAW